MTFEQRRNGDWFLIANTLKMRPDLAKAIAENRPVSYAGDFPYGIREVNGRIEMRYLGDRYFSKALVKRTWVYVQRPKEYGISGCVCGNADPDWSEFRGHVWCGVCQKDFIPESGGIFDGPVPVNACALMGIDLRRFSIATGQIEPVPGADLGREA